MKFDANGVGSWGGVRENAGASNAASEGSRPIAGAGYPVEGGAVHGSAVQGGTVPGKGLAGTSAKGELAGEETSEGEKLAAEMRVFNATAAEFRKALSPDAPFEERVANLMLAAAELFGLAPTWTAFYREVLGAEGLMRYAMAAGDETSAFECSSEHTDLLGMLTVLRSRDLPENDPFEQQRMITVRIPKSLHDSICEEANALAVSVNKLCISRLLQKMDRTMIPASGQKRRGRRPGSTPKKAQGAPEAQVMSAKFVPGEGSPNFIRTGLPAQGDVAQPHANRPDNGER